ncbi:MAG: class I SAM-dependent methyltransferase, partial [bacterium]
MIASTKQTAALQLLASVNGVDPAVYGDHYYRDVVDGIESMNHPGLAAIQRLAQNSRNILDCGCGEGSKLSYVGAPDAMRTGVEWSEEGVRRASQRPGLKVVRADIRRMPFPDGTFDFVFSAYVLEHTTEPEAVVAEMLRVLATGGHLALLCPNYGSPFFCSPCSRANPWRRAIRLALRDVFIGWRSRHKLIWQAVVPIATAEHWFSD